MKNNEEFRQFQRDQVRLNKTRRKQLGEHMTALHNYLSENHPGFIRTERQGSHALRTIIRPTTDDAKADADIMVMVRYVSKDYHTYVPDIARTLEANPHYQGKITVKNRCVTVRYSEPSKLEVDLVPCVESEGKFYVCPRDGAGLEETDGTGYREWFNEKNSITSGNLKRAVRALKYARDHRKRFNCPSIVLTTLAAQTITSEDRGTEAVSTHADIMSTVLERMSARLDKMPYPPSVKNPALASESFDPQWSMAQYDRFRATIRTMAKDAKAALLEKDPAKSIAKWQKVCGEKFTAAKDGPDGDNKSSRGPAQSTGRKAAPAASIPVANRQGEARPFG